MMGAVKVDLHVKERALDSKYHALDSADGVRLLLGDYHALDQRRFTGDTAASDILIDLATAINLSKLTNRQRQALRLVYLEDLTQKDAGVAMGIGQDVISYHIDNALEAIAEIFYYWCGHGEGYTAIEGESDEIERN